MISSLSVNGVVETTCFVEDGKHKLQNDNVMRKKVHQQNFELCHKKDESENTGL